MTEGPQRRMSARDIFAAAQDGGNKVGMIKQRQASGIESVLALDPAAADNKSLGGQPVRGENHGEDKRFPRRWEKSFDERSGFGRSGGPFVPAARQEEGVGTTVCPPPQTTPQQQPLIQPPTPPPPPPTVRDPHGGSGMSNVFSDNNNILPPPPPRQTSRANPMNNEYGDFDPDRREKEKRKAMQQRFDALSKPKSKGHDIYDEKQAAKKGTTYNNRESSDVLWGGAPAPKVPASVGRRLSQPVVEVEQVRIVLKGNLEALWRLYVRLLGSALSNSNNPNRFARASLENP